MTDCHTIQEQLAELVLGGQVHDRESLPSAVQAHLRHCAECRQEFVFLATLQDACAVAEPAETEFDEEWHRAFREETLALAAQSPRPLPIRPRRSLLRYAAAAGILFLALLGSLLLCRQQRNQSETVVQRPSPAPVKPATPSALLNQFTLATDDTSLQRLANQALAYRELHIASALSEAALRQWAEREFPGAMELANAQPAADWQQILRDCGELARFDFPETMAEPVASSGTPRSMRPNYFQRIDAKPELSARLSRHFACALRILRETDASSATAAMPTGGCLPDGACGPDSSGSSPLESLYRRWRLATDLPPRNSNAKPQ